MTIYYTILQWDEYEVYLAATGSGLIYLATGTEGEFEMKAWLEKHFPDCNLHYDQNKMSLYTKEISDYLQGKIECLESARQLTGTDFQKEVWREVEKVAYGEVRSYADIANNLGRPKAVRAVASAIGINHLLFIMPCHRIVRKDASLSGFRAGTDVKEKLLQLEQAK